MKAIAPMIPSEAHRSGRRRTSSATATVRASAPGAARAPKWWVHLVGEGTSAATVMRKPSAGTSQLVRPPRGRVMRSRLIETAMTTTIVRTTISCLAKVRMFSSGPRVRYQ